MAVIEPRARFPTLVSPLVCPTKVGGGNGNRAAALPGELGVGSEGTGAELNRFVQPFDGNGPASYEHIPTYFDAPDFKMVAAPRR